MNSTRSVYLLVVSISSLICFLFGLGLGALWSPPERPSAPDKRAPRGVRVENREFVERIGELYGEETAEFVKQFEDMTIRINEPPIDACASPDGRFVIRLFGSDETIASDLFYPDTARPIKAIVRHYSFSSAGKTYSCDIGRNRDNSRVTNVIFSFTDADGGELVYADRDADGRWDSFTDSTRDPSVIYDRDGLCWKKREKNTPHDPHALP